MQVKIYSDVVEKFINKFLQITPNIEVIDIKLSNTDSCITVLIIYRTN